MTTNTNTAAIIATDARAETLRAALIALALGGAVLFTIGFAHTAEIHNAAHDTRHAMAFPCH